MCLVPGVVSFLLLSRPCTPTIGVSRSCQHPNNLKANQITQRCRYKVRVVPCLQPRCVPAPFGHSLSPSGIHRNPGSFQGFRQPLQRQPIDRHATRQMWTTVGLVSRRHACTVCTLSLPRQRAPPKNFPRHIRRARCCPFSGNKNHSTFRKMEANSGCLCHRLLPLALLPRR